MAWLPKVFVEVRHLITLCWSEKMAVHQNHVIVAYLENHPFSWEKGKLDYYESAWAMIVVC